MANNLTLTTLGFLNRCKQAEFNMGGFRKWRITRDIFFGFYVTWLSVDDGGFECITNSEGGACKYETFAEALNAIIEHDREM